MNKQIYVRALEDLTIENTVTGNIYPINKYLVLYAELDVETKEYYHKNISTGKRLSVAHIGHFGEIVTGQYMELVL
jgi:hypothetical protein